MSEDPTPTPPKAKRSPKTRHESLGYFFGQPLESFENLLQSEHAEHAQPSTSTLQSKIKPTDLDIIRHWMYLEDQNKANSNIGVVTDNLMHFYIKHHPSVGLR